MHFFNEALAADYKEYQAQASLYLGRAKLNLLIGQFKDCKDDALSSLKNNDTNSQAWLILCRSRYFVEKWQEGLEYVKKGLAKCPDSDKLKKICDLFNVNIGNEASQVEEVEAIKNIKSDKKLDMYKFMREKKVKIGKKIQMFEELPDNLELNITKDKEGKLHFPVFLLYD